MLNKRKEQLQLLHVLLLIQIAKVRLPLSSATGPTDNNLICDHCQCSCPGSNLVLICNVSGSSSGSTIWKGTGFDCSETNNEVVLDHHGFTSRATDACSDGRIVGRPLSQGYGHFVSQLTVSNVTPDMNGTVVQCLYDDGITESLVNETIILIPNELNTNPTSLRLDNINISEMSILWDPVVPNCSQYHYNIFNQNCGICPDTTNLTHVTCQLCGTTIHNHQECILGVQPVICNDIVGVTISDINVTIKLPGTPRQIDAVSNCNGTNGQLIIYSRVHDSERNIFSMSSNKDGSPQHYTITYNEIVNRTECGSVTIPATSCPRRVCEHEFDVSNSQCSTSTMFAVNVYATNALGRGPTLTSKVTNKCWSTITGGQNNTCTSVGSQTCQIHDNWLDNGQGTCTAQVAKCERDQHEDSNVPYCLHVTTNYGDGVRNTSIVTQLPYNISCGLRRNHLVNALSVLVAVLLSAVIVLAIIVLILGIIAYRWKLKMERALKDSWDLCDTLQCSRRDSECLSRILLLTLSDTCGSLCTVLKVIKEKEVSIEVLNTLKRTPNVSKQRGYIRFTCVHDKITSIIREIKQIEGAKVKLIDSTKDVQDQIDEGSGYKAWIKFSLNDEFGTLYNKLTTLQEHGISIGVMNTLTYCDAEGKKSGYIACDCTDATLLEKLFDSKVLSEIDRRDFTFHIST